ncbi:DUF155 domain containing protein, partial [Sarcoptes scabiei]
MILEPILSNLSNRLNHFNRNLSIFHLAYRRIFTKRSNSLFTSIVSSKRDRSNSKRNRASSSSVTDSHRFLINSIKRRIPKKKINISGIEGLSTRPVIALSTADEYLLDEFRTYLISNGLYEPVGYDETIKQELDDDVLHLTAKYAIDDVAREFFVFSEGSIVFWNMSFSECEAILKPLRDFEVNSYKKEVIFDEKEEIDIALIRSAPSKLSNGLIHLNLDNDENSLNLEKYAFSNAIALSVKLSIWEANLDHYIESIGYITQDMKEGRKIRLTREQVFKKTGQLFGLRHRLNLSSDMLDTPDFYWDREDLEKLFLATYSHLNISKRTKVMNEKLNHCIELMDLLSNHLNDIHH